MLVSFSLQNWKSFKNRVTISAIAGRQRMHSERVPKIKKYGIKILPILAIYGGNASGKSNLFQAFLFARRFVVNGAKTPNELIDVYPYSLCSENRSLPTKFWFTFLVDEYMYELYFSVTREGVREEKLTRITSVAEEELYERKNQEITIWGRKGRQQQQLESIKEFTRENQLFITSTIMLNNNSYKGVYDWFDDGIRLISPQSRYEDPQYISDEKHSYYRKANSILSQLDTGVKHLALEKVEGLEADALDLDKIKTDDEKYEVLSLLETLTGEKLVKSSENGREVVNRVVSYHKCEDGSDVKFDIKEESAGTKRLIELLPVFIEHKKGVYCTFIIDEIDRSLHHLLLRNLIERYLNNCSEDTRLQMIFTTHDLLLLDQELLRRDEIYVLERKDVGSSEIIPLNEYKGLRFDKDILKSYLQGRFGGIPKI